MNFSFDFDDLKQMEILDVRKPKPFVSIWLIIIRN